jgi:crotonobetainyl-CoA:carnitine CoA-transferase CaiB-like acyl-CoA transferase
MKRPLEGLRVLELARILAGPWAGQLLADLGADVVKVERAGAGDDTRTWGPPFVMAPDGENLSAAYFHSANRGKRSILLDLSTDEGQAAVRKLAARADIVLENFKVGGLARYGLDHESLKAVNPRLIYCSITGFGQDGPYAAHAGYDFLIQGMGGAMSLNGTPDGEPMKDGVAIADLFTGLYAVSGILAALHKRDRTGEGAYIDMALLDSQVAVLGYQAMNYLVSGIPPIRRGNAHPNIVPYQVYPASDAYMIIAVGNDGQFARLCAVLGAPELADDPDYRKNEGRVRNRDALNVKLEVLESETLIAALLAQGIPAGPINTIDQVFDDPQVKHRQIRRDIPDIGGAMVPTIACPIVIDGERMVGEKASPRLGEDMAIGIDAIWADD